MTKLNNPFPQLGTVYKKGHAFGQASLPSKNVTAKCSQGWNTDYSAPSAWERPNVMHKQKEKIAEDDDDVVEDDDDVVFASSDDEGLSDDDDDLELETNEKNHESCKRNKWFKAFFADMDSLATETLNSTARRWHCPACKGGPGAIDWYRSLAPLMHHAMTIKTRRVKLHRLFSDILNEEAHRRGISISPSDVPTGRWEGLDEHVKDHQIVWPPMVMIVNTKCEQMENGKWIGMGSQELLDHFQSFSAIKAKHAYGPKGHRGISVMIFGYTAAGYFEAERLDKHFKAQGRGRDAWYSNKVPRFIAGKRQLCGYMASKEDMNDFNLHCQGKSKLKFEMRSYQEMVERQINQINENLKLKDEYEKSQKHVQVLSGTISTLSQKMRETKVSNCELRKRTMTLLQQNKEELDSQDQFFKEQLKVIHQAIDDKEDNFEKLQQQRWAKFEQPNTSLSSRNDSSRSEMEEFEAERKKVIEIHEQKKCLVMKTYREDLLQLDKELENEISQLMEKYNKSAETSNTY